MRHNSSVYDVFRPWSVGNSSTYENVVYDHYVLSASQVSLLYVSISANKKKRDVQTDIQKTPQKYTNYF